MKEVILPQTGGVPGVQVDTRCPSCGKAMMRYGRYYHCAVNWMCGKWYDSEQEEKEK